MEESKELQTLYTIFRRIIYISIVVEIFMYAIAPEALQSLNSVVYEVWRRMKVWTVYADGHIIYSKVMTFLIVFITCIGTKNKKSLEFDSKKMVYYPLTAGILLTIMSVFAYWGSDKIVFKGYWVGWMMSFYILFTVVGTILTHVAFDNIWKHLKEGLMKDRFNFENESFEQCTELVETDYSVNIPMKFYYKKKFRDGWVNISNPFRGRRRTNRAISVKLIYWLKLNVNNLKSAIWAK